MVDRKQKMKQEPNNVQFQAYPFNLGHYYFVPIIYINMSPSQFFQINVHFICIPLEK